MDGPGVIAVDNETQSTTARMTKGGRRISYKLTVIQQPSRARACGSGAKSSADRRPVDPPAIVELKIYESDGEGEMKDVTFSMNASYLLFATLEQARHMARGRVQQEQQRPVILTGMPVAGMVYLDRPHPAGYFIFPDLSVRHEGNYRLSFNLYEESKDSRDEDPEPKGATGQHGYVTHRLEVRSVPFTVYSAKKFPGLMESTSLSRMVAEQGCRVRIRRDVRMRRRDNKSNKEWDGYEEETSEMRARHSATPEASAFTPHAYMDPIPRPRSGSNASHISVGPPVSRRPSLPDVNQAYTQGSYGAAPQTPQNAHAQSSPFISGPTPSHPHAQPPFMQQQSSMQPPPLTYQQSHQQAPPSLPPAPAAHQGYYGYAPAPPPVYESSHHPQRQSVDYSPQLSSDRRSSSHYAPPPPPVSYSSAQQSHGYQSQPAPPAPSYHQQTPSYPMYSNNHHPHHQSSVSASDVYIRPAEPVQPPTRTSGAHTPLSARPFNDKLPPLNTTFNMSSSSSSGNKIEPASPIASYAAAPPPPRSFVPDSSSSNKRNYGEVFSERHLAAPLRHGSRPGASATYHHGYTHPHASYGGGNGVSLEHFSLTAAAATENEGASAIEPDSHHELENQMVYRRADGRCVNRSLPPHD